MRIRLKYWRQKRVISITELAEKSHVSTATIADIELRHHTPRMKSIRRLAAALDVPLEDFVVVTEDEEEEVDSKGIAS